MNPLDVVIPAPATGFLAYAWLLIAIPLASAAVLLLVGRAGDRWGHYLGTLAPIASFVVGVVCFVELLGQPPDQRAFSVPLYD